ncbi:UDP-N-acetyl-D-mannosamine dehydrogenase [Altererythrobacter sp. BO-6]|uniref:UDP-N-acetyl-D-mannosamine dehydrogenase n=1 Tax=Altererythrobacter sp. BO-6 TaxID=2604537 RepID=UPI0013E1F4D6|nr:UDP-N-acetyl-D-mannosamine dehydrogenase [Altererythrobacter sp. BO-6]QIG54263.1 UDP-N-acetyl-D-mannosamine dehydrogenase [Altererythrobacter sp. BO-6]
MQFEKISVIGLGYIGLPTAAMFASRKIQVVGVDVNEVAVETINRGQIHIVEPDLDMVVHAAVNEGYLRATTTPEPADAFLIAVPTPFKGENHEPDLSYIEAASKAIAPFLEKGNLVVLESTSPVGATEAMADWLAAARPDLSFPQNAGEDSDVRIAHCPERVLPGKIMQELVSNDRVIGGVTPRCSQIAAALYGTFVTGECVVASSPRVAEMAKLTENSFRDVNIAFANELSMICDKLDIDVWELLSLANRHPRVNILRPGPGVGGHCIAVDPWFIVSSAPDQTKLIRIAREVNDKKPQYVIDKIVEAARKIPRPQIVCLGLSYKADVDDLRESPAVGIVKQLVDLEIGEIIVVEPFIEEIPIDLAKQGIILGNLESAIAEANIIVLLVDHAPFLRIDRSALEGKTLIDTRGAW